MRILHALACHAKTALLSCIVLAGILIQSAGAQQGKPLVFGVVGYGSPEQMTNLFGELIKYLNDQRSGYKIRETPIILSYENAVHYALESELDIVLFTPATYAKVSIKDKNLFTPVAITKTNFDARLTDKDDDHFPPVATTKKTPPARPTYVGKILYNPYTIKVPERSENGRNQEKPAFERIRDEGLPRLALLWPYSAAGYFYPLKTLHDKGILDLQSDQQKNLETPPIEILKSTFQLVRSVSHTHTLEMFFGTKTDSPLIDVAPIYEGELRSFLEGNTTRNGNEISNLEKVRDWISNHGRGEWESWCEGNLSEGGNENGNTSTAGEFLVKADSERIRKFLLDTCVWAETDEIPNDIVAVRSELNGVVQAIRDSLKKLDEQLMKSNRDGTISEDLVNSFKAKGIYGFLTGEEERLDEMFDGVRDIYRRFKDENLENFNSIDASMLVQDVVYDSYF